MELNTRYGLEFDPFLKNAKEILYEGAVISKLCHTCLVIGNSRGQNIITAETAMQAINDCTLS